MNFQYEFEKKGYHNKIGDLVQMEECMIRFRAAPGSIPGLSRENVNLLETKRQKEVLRKLRSFTTFCYQGYIFTLKGLSTRRRELKSKKHLFSLNILYCGLYIREVSRSILKDNERFAHIYITCLVFLNKIRPVK